MHRTLTLLFALAFSGISLAAAPTAARSWQSTAGTSLEAKATILENDTVTFEAVNGRIAKVPLDRLIEADREFLKKHFAPEESAPAELAHPLGKVVGPIDAGGSTYFLYLPNSLKPGKLHPLLFFTSSGGGKPERLNEMKDAAELCGWIITISVESKNGIPNSLEHSQRCIDHIKKSLPVDSGRLYFSGNSGGAREAFSNGVKMGAAGVLAITAGAQPGELKKGSDYFFISGANDFNRAGIAISYADAKSGSALRFHPGGHGMGPAWLTTEGFVWLEGQARRKSSNDPTQADYETKMLAWTEKIAATEPHRAAWWTTYFKQGKFTPANQGTLDALHNRLIGTPASTAYIQGVADLEEFAAKVLVKEPQYSPECFNSTSPSVQKAADKLLETHSATPWIKEVLVAAKKQTDKL
jgi:hypothetical protein